MSVTSGAFSLRRFGRSQPRRALPPGLAVFRRAFMDARIRTISFACVFAIVAYINPASYRSAYPTLQSRLAFAHSFGNNKAVVLFYGKAYDILTVGGYTAWRSGGTLAIFAAVFGVFAAVRAMRTEEDTGRAELVLSGLASRRTVYLASLAAIAAGIAVLWAAEFAGLLLASLPAGSSAYLALATASVVPVFVGVGAICSQLAPNRRMAIRLSITVVAVMFLLRVIADTSSVGWVRWLTPLGWAEAMRPFSGAQPLVLVLPAAVTVALLVPAGLIARRRDLGAGLLPAHDTAAPRLRLLSSPTAHALRQERGALLVWLFSTAVFALVVGVVSKSINSSVISKGLQQQLEKFGEGSIINPRGYIAFAFIFFALALALFACAQVAAARHEEAEEQLETLLALPVGRRQWLLGRLGIACAGAVAIALVAGLLAWAGAEAEGVHLSLSDVLAAGANCLPVAALFLGLAALAYAVAPRASTGIAYGLVAVAFLWYLFGSLVGVPHWVVKMTPFAHIAAVPAQPFQGLAAVVMVAVGAIAAVAAVEAFERRDLLGA